MILDSLKPREKKLLIIALVIVLGFGFYYWVYQPQVNDLTNAESKLEQTVQNLKVKSAMLQRKEELEKKYQLLLDKLESRKEERFLKPGEKTQLIMDLSDIAMEANVNLISTNPKSTVKKDIYIQFPVKIKLRGEYNEIINFIEKVGNLGYLTRIDSFSISSDLVPTEEIQVSMELSSYAIDRSSGDQK
jgi:type IV pilus assembly protein PilO